MLKKQNLVIIVNKLEQFYVILAIEIEV